MFDDDPNLLSIARVDNGMTGLYSNINRAASSRYLGVERLGTKSGQREETAWITNHSMFLG